MQRIFPAAAVLAILQTSCSPETELKPSATSMFTDLQLDYQNTLVITTADAPPLGTIDLKFVIEGFEKKWSVAENPSGWGGILRGVPELNSSVAGRDFENIQSLSESWASVWPPMFEAFMTVRNEYDAPVTRDNLLVTITAPGETEGTVSEHWSAGFELKEWDGFYYVEFNEDGEIIDSGVSF